MPCEKLLVHYEHCISKLKLGFYGPQCRTCLQNRSLPKLPSLLVYIMCSIYVIIVFWLPDCPICTCSFGSNFRKQSQKFTKHIKLAPKFLVKSFFYQSHMFLPTRSPDSRVGSEALKLDGAPFQWTATGPLWKKYCWHILAHL